MSAHNLCFGAKIRKKGLPLHTPVLLYKSRVYSPFHSSLPFEHLGQSNLFSRVCHLFVNQVTFYPILEL